MARPARPWFRMYVETVNDLKLRRQPADVRWVWVAVLASARQSPLPGHLLVSERIPMTMHDLAEVAAVTAETAEKAVDAFIEADMLDRLDDGSWYVVNWDKRQFESDNRGGKSSDDETTTEPLRNDNGTAAPESETESEEKPPAQEPDGFEDFWQLYPPRDGKKVGKAKSHKIWQRMTKLKREAAMIGVENYRVSGWRPKDPERWLRDEVWEDWQEPATTDEQGAEVQFR